MAFPSTPQRPIAAEVHLLSLITSGASKKRKITPSSEASSPKRLAVIASPDAAQFPEHIIQRLVVPNPLFQAEFAPHTRIGK
jgi:hypothetical protein